MNNCVQGVYQLKVGHATNCLISQYPSRVVLSLRFCLFWEDSSKLCINTVMSNACQQPPELAYTFEQEKVKNVRDKE